MSQHTEQARENALEYLRDPSKSYATIRDATGIPIGTLSRWAKENGLARAVPKPLDDALEVRKQRIANRRVRLTEKLFRYAENMLDQANERASGFVEVKEGKGIFVSTARDAKDLMVAVGIAIDKGRLELGEPTEHTRTDHNVSAAEAAKQRLDELAERRKQKSA